MSKQGAKTERSVVDHFYRIIGPLIRLPRQKIINFGTTLPIPRFDESDIKELCEEATNILKPQGPLLKIDPPCYVVGDIHGDLHDLLRIFSEVGDLTKTKIIFLGDYIDRGGFSLEVVIVLFTVLCKFPNNVILLRGNHEFPNVYSCTSLSDELKGLYQNNSLFHVIHNVFIWLPLATLVAGKYLCLHGGIGPDLNSISDIQNIPYPITNYDESKLVADILWSDPCKTIMNFLDSTRGCGMFFGQTAISQFIKENNLKMLIRAHQCIYDGVEIFKDLVMTVFSTSFYNDEENKGAFVHIDQNLEIQTHILQPMKPIRRAVASYAQVAPRKGGIIKRPVIRIPSANNPISPTGHLIMPQINRARSRLSLTLVPAIVRPRLPDLDAELIPTISVH
ncbi:Serine/threonine-protein phosphatase PP1 [Tritrichomonas foetus]|uniref:Serine/threonine-protein phosphatase n=1 Tax=Tritrichomonas foetus TaxID=1144522 RepID=A0A1J4KQE4_9EUKA|nr:Serine/threonine-protein phosphatase PP1 [Tritrichomonas foetus]|eukprot:OHT12012.1 Serine/threonine-protein phosphatase PP1 [Tritrichomonas foetus]